MNGSGKTGTVLEVTISGGNEEIIAHILERSPLVVDAKDKRRWAPLQVAAMKRQVKAISLLLARGEGTLYLILATKNPALVFLSIGLNVVLGVPM